MRKIFFALSLSLIGCGDNSADNSYHVINVNELCTVVLYTSEGSDLIVDMDGCGDRSPVVAQGGREGRAPSEAVGGRKGRTPAVSDESVSE